MRALGSSTRPHTLVNTELTSPRGAHDHAKGRAGTQRRHDLMAPPLVIWGAGEHALLLPRLSGSAPNMS